MVKVLGAGLSGLSCAINLALSGREVVVFERRSGVGLQVHENYQVLQTRGKIVEEYLGLLNLSPRFNHFSLSKSLFSTASRDLDVLLNSPVHFVQRGGISSLEHGLCAQALDLGVKFKFGARTSESEVDVVATGPKSVDSTAYGAVYENVDFPRDKFLMMYDDRYSPKGWYFYVIPFGENLVEVVNCASQPHGGRVKELFYRALSERDSLKKYFEGKTPVSTFGGFGSVNVPKTALKDGRLLVGEAAGFQDPFRGFGMNFALESGFLAAHAIKDGENYDMLWKRKFMPQFKLDFSRRLVISVLGSRVVDLMYRGVKSGDAISFKSGDLGSVVGESLKSVLFSAELLKRKITGYW